MKKSHITLMIGILSYSLFVAVLFFAPSFFDGTVGIEENETLSTTWLNHYETATKLSAEQNLPIFANFTGSDWCETCIMMDKQVFNTKHFNQWAQGNVILLRLDYPEKKTLPETERAQNERLDQRYKIEEYPTNFLLNKKGEVLAKLADYQYNPDQWFKDIDLQLKSITH